jgi:hypothetical protein
MNLYISKYKYIHIDISVVCYVVWCNRTMATNRTFIESPQDGTTEYRIQRMCAFGQLDTYIYLSHSG